MRPKILEPLFAPLTKLDGIGPRLEKLFDKLLGKVSSEKPAKQIDLLWHLPSGVTDRSFSAPIYEIPAGTRATLTLVPIKHSGPPRRKGRAPFKVRCENESGTIDLLFFRGDPSYITRQLPIGEERIVSGKIEFYAEHAQMIHPDLILKPEEKDQLLSLEPTYPLTAGLTGKTFRKALAGALNKVPPLDEWQDESWLNKNKWPPFNEAIKRLHHPEEISDIAISSPIRKRLAFDELLATQLALALVRQNIKKQKGRTIKGDGALRQKIIEQLPFALTGSQETALGEIYNDLESPYRMLRLLQGDVGSGKTIVALLSLTTAKEAGLQGAFMAPTEVLARQHYQDLKPLCDEAGITITLLTGREKGKTRTQILKALEAGLIDILIGTHALFQPSVVFKNLGLAVIDEQHRFGVEQRLALQSKGGKQGTDVLVMTATPIPRTLQMTHYGDMDVSFLKDKPAGRKPVITRALPTERLDDILTRLKQAIAEKAQIYWVCPLVENSDLSDLTAVEERHGFLKQYLHDKIGLVHGKMAGAEKDEVMAKFASGELAGLVATTVIEVGVNVPNASIMVIEHAERFGLSQLHQLRGRVGRGERQSSCVLLYYPPLGKTARARIDIMRESEDGFLIADEDLKLRGGGEMLGTRQSGLPGFRLAEIEGLGDLLEAARDDVGLILNKDPALETPRGKALRHLLYLFECDEAIHLFKAG